VDRLKILLPIGTGGLIAGLPIFFIACDYFMIEKTKLVTAAFIAVWIVFGVMGAIGRRLTVLSRPLIFLCWIGFLSLYYLNWAMWPKGTEADEIMWASSMAFAVIPFILGSLFEGRDIRIFFIVITLWGMLLAVLVLASYISDWETRYTISRFTVGESLNPISEALIIGFAVISLYAQVLSKVRYSLITIILSLMFSMLLSGSRGPAIALVVALIVMTFFSQSISRRALLILILVFGLSGVLMSLPDPLLERYFSTDRWLTTQTEEGIPLRIDRAMLALERWYKYPFFGSGTSGNEELFYSHNLVIQILMELGVVGLVLFLMILLPLVSKFFKGLSYVGHLNWETLGFTGFLIYGLIEAQVSGSYMGLNFLWFSMGVLTSWPRIAQRPIVMNLTTINFSGSSGIRL